MTAIAAPAEKPATKTRLASTVYALATSPTIPESSCGSPEPRAWSAGRNQLKHCSVFAVVGSSGYATRNPPASAFVFICVPAAKSDIVCVQPWSIITSGTGVPALYDAGTYSMYARPW